MCHLQWKLSWFGSDLYVGFLVLTNWSSKTVFSLFWTLLLWSHSKLKHENLIVQLSHIHSSSLDGDPRAYVLHYTVFLLTIVYRTQIAHMKRLNNACCIRVTVNKLNHWCPTTGCAIHSSCKFYLYCRSRVESHFFFDKLRLRLHI